MTIQEIIQNYKSKIDYLDIEILIAHSLGKTREFVLTYPEYLITKIQNTKINNYLQRRISGEPVAYIIGHKEFYGLDFAVNEHTLVPRPETEIMVEEVTSLLRNMLRSNTTVIDVGTGSGCIIVSIANELEKNKNLDSRLRGNDKVKYFASDISQDALKIAKKNAKLNGVDKKIKFLHGSLFDPIIGNWELGIGNSRMIILANLPYLSKEIYNSAPVDVKRFEPKSALYSPEQGLQHYRKLLEQLKKIQTTSNKQQAILLLEISPEQKQLLTKLIKSIFPAAKVELKKDLANKWRICKITIFLPLLR